jgi:thiamine biosynthesis lipoprotein
MGTDLIRLHEADHTVELSSAPIRIDLGGIGKGYAVDKMAELLRDWSIDTALISGGGSSVLSLGAPPATKGWLLVLRNPANRKDVLTYHHLHSGALSGSDLQAGPHIIDPATAQPVKDRLAAWACAPTAAAADALSTAFMIMDPEQITQYCAQHLDTVALLVLDQAGKDVQQETILRIGGWEELSAGD